MGRGRSAGRAVVALGRAAPRRQRGAYAVEFAFTFLILFSLVYAGLALAVAFAGNQLLAMAAEDGARAALRLGADVPGAEREACRIAGVRSQMFDGVCEASVETTGAACAMSAMTGGACLRVRVTASSPIPQIPLFAAVLPSALAGHATVRLESGAQGVAP